MDTLLIEKPESIFRTEELPPMTLQIVLRGADGVVIASDTCVSSRPNLINVTDSDSKMVMKPGFVCTWAGDDWTKLISMEVIKNADDSGFAASTKFIEEVDKALKKYQNGPHRVPVHQYRKILWIQSLPNSDFAIWAAHYEDRTETPFFELVDPQSQNSIFAGDEGNFARYFVEHYYKKGQGPDLAIENLKKIAAHVIRTGHIFNSAGVDGLEMVVGQKGKFFQVPPEVLEKIDKSVSGIHRQICALFEA